MQYTISTETCVATVNSVGACIDTFTYRDKDVFFPRQEIDGKLRGGCHVCAPNFGPGGVSKQPQHGNARNLEWDVTKQGSDCITLILQDGAYEYSLKHTLTKSGLAVSLTVKNISTDRQRVSPGFHPYFVVPDNGLQVSGVAYQPDELSQTIFLKAKKHTVVINGHSWHVSSDQLNTYALWSAHSDRYLCVEPTYNGNSFLQNTQPPSSEIIEPGEECYYDVSISIN